MPCSPLSPSVIPDKFIICSPASSVIFKSSIPSALNSGASFTAITSTFKVIIVSLFAPTCSSGVAPLSVIVIIRSTFPLALETGVNFISPVSSFCVYTTIGSGIKDWFKLEATMEIFWSPSSPSVILDKFIVTSLASSKITTEFPPSISAVGASLTPPTSIVKV